MILKGRAINKGNAEGEAVVFKSPFSFTGDFDVNTGTLIRKDHPSMGEKIAQKILVFPMGKGAVNAAITLYKAHKQGNAPSGIICRKADPLTLECAITIDIPIMDSFDKDPVREIKNGDTVKMYGESGEVHVGRGEKT
jgi:predicted aconitase with swiveling domain